MMSRVQGDGDGPFGAPIYRDVRKQGAACALFHLDIKKALQAFNSQKHNAKRRGIGWELTFKEWCEFWGEDIDKRGARRDQLGMQRIMDAGPYKVGNIRKGRPRDNVRTRECAQWDNGNRIKPPVLMPRAWASDELDDGSPDLGIKSIWDRIVA